MSDVNAAIRELLDELNRMRAELAAKDAEIARLRSLCLRSFCEGFGFASIDCGKTNLDAIIGNAEKQWRGSQSRAALGDADA